MKRRNLIRNLSPNLRKETSELTLSEPWRKRRARERRKRNYEQWWHATLLHEIFGDDMDLDAFKPDAHNSAIGSPRDIGFDIIHRSNSDTYQTGREEREGYKLARATKLDVP